MVEDEASQDWSALGEMLRVNSRARGRGDYWFWKDKPEREAGAAKEVLTSAGHHVVDIRARQPGQDPPDCEAIIDGEQCGVEVSELLDQQTLEASITGREQHRAWTSEDLCLAIQKRIDRKDCPARVKGGPYERYFLVIVTDELVLFRENVAQFLAGAAFQARFITDAYLGLSYQSGTRRQGLVPGIQIGYCPASGLINSRRRRMKESL